MEWINREIKFNLIGTNMSGEFINETYTLEELMDSSWQESYSIDIIAKRQFTGLKDKNGVEIYADCEIFKFKWMTGIDTYDELIGVMNFNDEELRYEVDVYQNDNYTCLSYLGNGQMYDFEVIGNIFEHSELLDDCK